MTENERAPQDANPRFDERLLEAEHAWRLGSPRASIALLEVVVAESIGNLRHALLALGHAHGELEQWPDALVAFERLGVLWAGNPDGEAIAENNRAWALAHLGRGEEALAAADRALDRATEPQLRPMILLNRALALSTLGRYEDALASSEDAAALEPANPDIAFDRACYLARLGRGADALEGLSVALALEPALAQRAATDVDLRGLAESPESADAFASLVAAATYRATALVGRPAHD